MAANITLFAQAIATLPKKNNQEHHKQVQLRHAAAALRPYHGREEGGQHEAQRSMISLVASSYFSINGRPLSLCTLRSASSANKHPSWEASSLFYKSPIKL
ncbi:MAG: hypothetical protein MJZ72_05385 [Bacteroidales bacterium]|nr:hypothetical protein [Bacteroidales bacterium]